MGVHSAGEVYDCLVLFVHKISWEPLNGFVPDSHGRCVWSLARMSLKVKVKDQGHEGQMQHFLAIRRPACGLFGKISLASSFWATVCKMVRPMQSVRCLFVCPVCLSCPVLSVTLA